MNLKEVSMYMLGIGFVLFIILSSLFYMIFAEYLAKCHNCKRSVLSVDSYYYTRKVGSNRRYMCALHYRVGYEKKYNYKIHYNRELRKLDREVIKEVKKKQVTVYIDQYKDKFIRMYKVIDPNKQTVVSKLDVLDDATKILDKRIGIYLITRKSDGRQYVGQSKNISSRWKQHARTLKVDGFHEELVSNPDLFTFKVLINCSENKLNFMEAYFINKYNTYHEGFNLTKGNYSRLGDQEKKLLYSI